MTWNLEWLSLKGDIEQSKRTEGDYAALRQIFNQQNPDLLAFQEVDSIQAITRIVPLTDYNIFLSERALSSTSLSSQQYTGWAVRKGIKVVEHPDLSALALPGIFSYGTLRYGAYIEIRPKGREPIHLLSVHLKSGCFSQLSRKMPSCKKLSQQTDILADWIAAKNNQGQHYVVAGDFNHFLNRYNNQLMTRLTENEQPFLLTEGLVSQCKVKRYNTKIQRWERMVYTNLIDHIISNRKNADNSHFSATQYHYPYHLTSNSHLSDHCPVIVKI
ncbi:endonuclease/exonuclease/phosphatase family protein [Veronia pacifica]|uniref:endonuclease/exonuclease/phosphatase family protein n=1 Tax=Veronia pacifica TaxID=1080227 RepID=UPI001586B693|nr:endonuclease/exonuclease/phosphatase family protein [Veronia pacifica]